MSKTILNMDPVRNRDRLKTFKLNMKLLKKTINKERGLLIAICF
jgi:hypothetical protein